MEPIQTVMIVNIGMVLSVYGRLLGRRDLYVPMVDHTRCSKSPRGTRTPAMEPYIADADTALDETFCGSGLGFIPQQCSCICPCRSTYQLLRLRTVAIRLSACQETRTQQVQHERCADFQRTQKAALFLRWFSQRPKAHETIARLV